MLQETQNETYFSRMAASLGDKSLLLAHVRGPRVLDVGAGGGELAQTLRLAGHEVWALDASATAVNRISEHFPDLTVFKGEAHEVRALTATTFQTIVCSAIFHEVYSYGIDRTGPYSVEALRGTLAALHEALEPNGRLVLRDGVMPNDWDEDVIVEVRPEWSKDFQAFLEEYLNVAPFASKGPRGAYRTVALERVGLNHWVGNRSSVMEFLYTYTWGWQDSTREMQEFYGLFTEKDYRDFIESCGFRVVSSEQYLQPGYEDHLGKRVRLFSVDGEAEPFPSSNFVLTAVKE